MEITPRVALEVATHEAIVRQAYRDSVGVWTWSVGLTNATGHRVERYINNPASMEQCLDVYIWALNNYAEAVRAEFAGHSLTEAQFAAALSFHWNTGAIRSASWPDKWKAGDMAGARSSFLAWKKPPEIMKRRLAEADLMFEGKWSGDGFITEYTRVRASGSPDWGSAKRVDIRDELAALLAPEAAPVDPMQGEAEPPSSEASARDQRLIKIGHLAAQIKALTEDIQ